MGHMHHETLVGRLISFYYFTGNRRGHRLTIAQSADGGLISKAIRFVWELSRTVNVNRFTSKKCPE